MKLHAALLAALVLTSPLVSRACEQQVVLSEHLPVTDPGQYYVVAIQRVHADNLVGTIRRSFGGGLVPGRTVSIHLVEEGLADAACAPDFAAGETWLLQARVAGGALRVARFNSHNVPAGHERFAAYVADIESALVRR